MSPIYRGSFQAFLRHIKRHVGQSPEPKTCPTCGSSNPRGYALGCLCVGEHDKFHDTTDQGKEEANG